MKLFKMTYTSTLSYILNILETVQNDLFFNTFLIKSIPYGNGT